MSLSKFRRPRVIVQHARRSVHDAARAMESNHDGLVVVEDHGRVAGVVTDRDLAVRVIGYGLDPLQTAVGEVMTTDVATLPISATIEQALALMTARGVRRIPLLEDGRVVGLVTIDDLILERAASLDDIAAVMSAQLAQPSALRPRGRVYPVEPGSPMGAASARGRHMPITERRPERKPHRSIEEAFGRLVHRVQTMAGLEDREMALSALELVLRVIVRTLTPDEGAELVARLPGMLKARLADPAGAQNPYVDRMALENELAQRLALSPDRAARLLADVGAALEQAANAGEVDVALRLPYGMGEPPSPATKSP